MYTWEITAIFGTEKRTRFSARNRQRLVFILLCNSSCKSPLSLWSQKIKMSAYVVDLVSFGDNSVLYILHTPLSLAKLCWRGLLWFSSIVVRFGRWSVSVPAGWGANRECPILFATECELKSLRAIWMEKCEEEPPLTATNTTLLKVHGAAKKKRVSYHIPIKLSNPSQLCSELVNVDNEQFEKH